MKRKNRESLKHSVHLASPHPCLLTAQGPSPLPHVLQTSPAAWSDVSLTASLQLVFTWKGHPSFNISFVYFPFDSEVPPSSLPYAALGLLLVRGTLMN